MADITSYDYDAPMDEAGNPTEKYMIFREVIKKHMDIADVPVPDKAKTMVLPDQTMRPLNSILSDDGRRILGSNPFKTNKLATFKDMRQFSGFLLYETTLPTFNRDPANLVVTDLRDRALVYIDHEFIGALSRENVIDRLPISMSYGSKLSILVENQGRINFEIADDYKVR
jgi:beta-galactosidase